MGARSSFSSDLMGRPAGLKRVHLVDASTFPTIPATTITYTIMANSDRIVNLNCSTVEGTKNDNYS
jgi:choline dehydrogenase-like flavoprotein